MSVAYVRDTGKVYVDGTSSGNVSFGTAPIVGNAVIVGAAAYVNSVAFTVTDNQSGNVYNEDITTSGADELNHALIHSALNVASTGTFTLTVHGGPGSFIVWGAAEFSGILQASAKDKTGFLGETAAAAGISVSTSADTTQADEVSITVVAPYNYSGSAIGIMSCTGFTVIWSEPDLTTHQPGAMAYRIEASTGTKTAAWTWTSTPGALSMAVIATYKGGSNLDKMSINAPINKRSHRPAPFKPGLAR